MKARTKRTVLITGAAGGIGRATVKKFARDKHFNIILIDHPSKWEDLKQLIKVFTRTATKTDLSAYIPQASCFDLTDLNINQWLDRITNIHKKIDVLVNVAGIAQEFGALVRTDLEKAKKVMDVNLWGTLKMCQAVLPIMQANGYGRIINVASISAFMPEPGNMIYSASKAGVVQITRALAKEAPFNKNDPSHPHNITVNAVAPGITETDMVKLLSEKIFEGYKRSTPFGRLVKPEEIAETIYWLATKAPQALTGQTIQIDGGFLA